MQISLGTVQFGLDYGVANHSGKIGFDEGGRILQMARENGITVLDTAAGYGESETLLGELGISDFQAVTKLPVWHSPPSDLFGWVKEQVYESLKHLKANNLYGLLLHRSEQMNKGSSQEILAAVSHLKSEGKLQKFGVSIYDPRELEAVFDYFVPDIVQAPLNVFDRRLLTSGWLRRLQQEGVEVHVRSVFLQGLLLLGKRGIPSAFRKWAGLFDEWHDWLDETGADPLTVCLAAVGIQGVDAAVVGVDGAHHLSGILAACQRLRDQEVPDIVCTDTELLHPFLWPNK